MQEDQFPIRELKNEEMPDLLREISDPPKKLFLRGLLPDPSLYPLSIVGSRKHTRYGFSVVEKLLSGLRGYPIAIISGLAIGIDGEAHRQALRAGLYTLAVPGSGLDWKRLYPRQHHNLAEQILNAGGGLLSEYAPDEQAAPWMFPRRNRIMAGLSKAVLLIEAHEKSGTLITARLAMEYNRDVLVVPGPIDSIASRGTNGLIREGAIPITSAEDILDALHIPHEKTEAGSPKLSPVEQRIWTALDEPKDRDTVIFVSELPAATALETLMDMEMKGLVSSAGGFISRK